MSKNTDTSDELLPCPGKRLKMAREAKGMDVAHAAEQLHLSRAMVNALEAEDYDKLPARVFVRGYYKNYARLVEVPEDDILQEFDDRCPDAECSAAPPVMARRARPEVHSGHKLVRLITWLVVITPIVMLVIWWQGYLGWPAKKEQAAVVSQTDETEISGMEKPLPQEAAIRGDEATAEEMDEDVIPVVGETTSRSLTDTVSDSDRVQSMPQNENDDTSLSVAQEKLQQARTVEAITVPVKPELTVSFSGECWVDIRDSTRQFKLFGRMQDGDMRKLGGEPPYKMVFGNYPAAKLMVDGKSYDLSAHANGNTAKFTFDPAAAEVR